MTRLLATLTLIVSGLTFPSLSFALERLTVDYIRPGADFSQYNTIYIHPLDLSRTKVVAPPWVENQNPESWSLNDEDIQWMQDLFIQTLSAEIEEDDRFKAVAEPLASSVEVRVAITRLTPYASRGEDVETKGSGEISVQVEYYDTNSGDLLAIVVGNQTVGEKYQRNSIDADKENVTELFKVWGQRLRQQWGKAHTK